jgi:hypothetical protein
MKTSYLAITLTLTCMLGLGNSALAQDGDRVTMSVPFNFVAGGETLPAGTYSISRVSDGTNRILVIRSDGNRIFLVPIFFDGTTTAVIGSLSEHPALSFEHVGDKYFLSKVETLSGVYAFRTPQPMMKTAQMKGHDGLPSSGK